MKTLLLVASAALFAFPVTAKQCAPHAVIADALADQYGEAVIVRGLMKGDAFILEIWASPETGTWSAVQTHTSGASCIVAAGQDMIIINPAPTGEPG